MMPMFRAAHGLADRLPAVRGECHDAGDLLDFELLARPAQAFAHGAHRRHGRAQNAAYPSLRRLPAHPPAAAAAAPAASGSAALLPGGSVNLGQQKRCGSSLSASLSFQRPLKSTPAGGARPACRPRKPLYRAPSEPRGFASSGSYNEARPGGYIETQPAVRRARGAARRSLGPQIHTRPSKG